VVSVSELLTALSVVFVVGGTFLFVANRFELPIVPFFIFAGIVAGPFVEEELTLELARYGIVLLVFTFSVQIQFESVRTVLSDSEGIALGQTLVLGGIGVVISVLIGLPADQAVYIGIAAALSSTIVGTGLLRTARYRNLVYGRLAESIHFVQDLIAILLILVLSAETFAADPVATQLGYGVVLIGVAIVVNRQLFDLLGRVSGDSDELMLVSVIALLIAFLGAAELAGISLAVGAFVAGLAVRRDPTEHLGMLNGLQSIRDFFTAIFFVTLGTLVAIPTTEVILVAGLLTVLTAIIKPAATIALLLYKGYETRSATLTSLNLAQVSEFALVIAIEGLVVGSLTQPVFDAIILAATVTMLTSSLSSRYDERIYRMLSEHGLLRKQYANVDERSAVPEDISHHVIIVGYGRQGRRLVETCEARERPYVVVENDPVLLQDLESECEAYVFGDAMEQYTWTKANVERAQLVVSTVDSNSVTNWILTLVEDADAGVVLRARTVSTARDLLERGALYVSVPEVLAAELLAEHVEAVAAGDVSRAELRADSRAELEQQAAAEYYTTADEVKAMR
jgi:CPA2 family monovalent cation:H+ antiporter-2